MAFLANIRNLLIIVIMIFSTTESQVIRLAADCEESCGNLKIPYPFGTKESCFLNTDFNITCNYTSVPPKPMWRDFEVENISTDDAEMRVFTDIAKDCYMPNGTQMTNATRYFSTMTMSTIPSFPFSHARNRFTVLGCDVTSKLVSSGQITGCISLCFSIHSATDGVCSGAGCCQTSIPDEPVYFDINIVKNDYNRTVSSFNPCSFAFVAADDFYNFSTADLKSSDLRGKNIVPSILDWSVGNQTCQEAKKDSTNYIFGQ